MKKDGKKHSRVFFTGAVLAACLTAFIVAYLLTALLYRWTGQPPEILRHLFSCLLAFVLIMSAWQVVMWVHGEGAHSRDYHRNIHDQLTNTLARIAQGDFTALMEPDRVGMYDDLAKAINDMARSLGTLETMRQDFISNVSHEIQSPLTSIGGFAALLGQEGLCEQDRQRYAAIIQSESRRLSSLSDNLLKLSALDQQSPPDASTFRLDKQLEQSLLTLEPQWAAKHLTVEADLERCDYCGDAGLLSQVWMNLLHNAVKFTPEGGNIHITLTGNSSGVTVIISDTGVGIAPQDQLHIFERFYKADKARDRSLGGNGLGLSLAQKIISLHNGSIAVDSKPGQGAVFTVGLPQQ